MSTTLGRRLAQLFTLLFLLIPLFSWAPPAAAQRAPRQAAAGGGSPWPSRLAAAGAAMPRPPLLASGGNTNIPLQLGLGEAAFYPLLGFGLSDRLAVQVNVASGNLVAHATDLVVAGTGLPLVVDRTYNSLSTAAGLFGNWTMGSATDVQLLNKDTAAVTVALPGDLQFTYPQNPDGSYTAPPGADAALVKNGDGSFTLTSHASGLRYQFGVVSDFYGTINSVTSLVDRNGNTISYQYSTDLNGNGNVLGITDTQGRQVASFNYGRFQQEPILSFKDSSGRLFQYGYNGNGFNLTDYTDPANQHTSYGYDASNNLTQVTDPTGRLTTLAYDGSHRLTSLTLGAGTSVAGTWTFTYHSGNTVVTDPNQHSTTYVYDSSGRVTQVTDAGSNTFQWSWNADNHVTQYTDGKGQPFTYGYDANNNLTATTLPTGAHPSAGYGTVTNIPFFFVPTSTTDAQGTTTTFTYDGNGNVKTVSMPAMVNSQSQTSTITARATYNSNGTVASSTDFNGNTTTYGYDTKGNLTTITPPSYAGGTQLGPTRLTPDALSRPAQVTDGNGHTTTSTYDPLDRVTNVQFADAAVGYGFDADGNLTSMTDSSGTTTYTYDARNRQTQKTLPSSLGSGTFSYGYDAASNLTSYQDAGGTVGYAYNSLNELTTLTEPGSSGPQTTFAYDPNHRRTSTTYPDGVVMTFGYDNSGRVSTVTATNPSTTLLGLTYSYAHSNQDTGLVWQVTENDNPNVGPYAGNPRNATTTYAYDPRGLMLTWLVHNNANNTNVHDYEYQYDANGNRTQIVADATVPTPPLNPKTALAYNPVNELTSTTLFNGSGGQVAQASWSWDANGNLTGNSGYPGISNPATLTYNQHNQTTSITDVYQHPVTMTYAGAGQAQRLSADWSNQPNPTPPSPAEFGHTTYTNALLGLMSRTDSLGTTYYTNDPSGLPVSERTPNGTDYDLFDGLGNVVMLVDPPNGTPVAITSPCPTGNQAGDQWQQAGSHALDQELHQAGGAGQVVTDTGTGNLKVGGGYEGASGTGPTQVGTALFAEDITPGGGAGGPGPFVYRGLDVGDWYTLLMGEGIVAQAPGANYAPSVQVNGRTPTQWISTSKSLSVAGTRFGQHGVVRIDLSKVYPYSQVLDISNGINGTGGYLNSLARRNQEVLIRDWIPENAIDAFYPAADFNLPYVII